jgi:putative component of membrane protein insertase Oxa1/YidC/SpoIIIJ protein YidD
VLLCSVLILHVSPSIGETTPDNDIPEQKSNVLIYCIKGWQQISYRTPLFNCQFKHNCSQFAIDSLRHNGMFIGTFQTTNRLIRCNPLAQFCYEKIGGYLVDDSVQNNVPVGNNLLTAKLPKPILTATSFIPGLNKFWAGKWSDALFTTTIVTIGFLSGKKRMDDGHYIRGGISLSVATLVHASDIYWSLRRNRQTCERVKR